MELVTEVKIVELRPFGLGDVLQFFTIDLGITLINELLVQRTTIVRLKRSKKTSSLIYSSYKLILC